VRASSMTRPTQQSLRSSRGACCSEELGSGDVRWTATIGMAAGVQQ
jgi:hypothetical protein